MKLAAPIKLGHPHAGLRRHEEQRGGLVAVAVLWHRLSSTYLLDGLRATTTGTLLNPCLGSHPQRSLRCKRFVSLSQHGVSLSQRRLSLIQVHGHLLKLLPGQLFLLINKNTPSASSEPGNPR